MGARGKSVHLQRESRTWSKLFSESRKKTCSNADRPSLRHKGSAAPRQPQAEIPTSKHDSSIEGNEHPSHSLTAIRYLKDHSNISHRVKSENINIISNDKMLGNTGRHELKHIDSQVLEIGRQDPQTTIFRILEVTGVFARSDEAVLES